MYQEGRLPVVCPLATSSRLSASCPTLQPRLWFPECCPLSPLQWPSAWNVLPSPIHFLSSPRLPTYYPKPMQSPLLPSLANRQHLMMLLSEKSIAYYYLYNIQTHPNVTIKYEEYSRTKFRAGFCQLWATGVQTGGCCIGQWTYVGSSSPALESSHETLECAESYSRTSGIQGTSGSALGRNHRREKFFNLTFQVLLRNNFKK